MLADMAARTYAMEAIADLGALLGDARPVRHPARGRDRQAVEQRRGVGAVRRGAADPRRARLRDRALARVARRGAGAARAAAPRSAHQPHLRGHEPGDAAVHRARGARPASARRERCGHAGRATRQAARRASCAPDCSTRRGIRAAGSGWGHWPQYAEFGALAGHLRWADRVATRSRAQQFHLMVIHGPALEKKQSAAVPLRRHRRRAVRDRGGVLRAPSAIARAAARWRTPSSWPTCSAASARHRIERLFAAIRSNDDAETVRRRARRAREPVRAGSSTDHRGARGADRDGRARAPRAAAGQ